MIYAEWFQRFRNGDFDLPDRERPGQPQKFKDKELVQFLEQNPTQMEKKLDTLSELLIVSKQFPIACIVRFIFNS